MERRSIGDLTFLLAEPCRLDAGGLTLLVEFVAKVAPVIGAEAAFRVGESRRREVAGGSAPDVRNALVATSDWSGAAGANRDTKSPQSRGRSDWRCQLWSRVASPTTLRPARCCSSHKAGAAGSAGGASRSPGLAPVDAADVLNPSSLSSRVLRPALKPVALPGQACLTAMRADSSIRVSRIWRSAKYSSTASRAPAYWP